VLQPTHADSIRLRRQQGERIGAARGLSEALEDATENPAAAANRARDISLVLDSLDEVERQIPALQGKMDRARIGVGGHSFGAMTAMLVGGAVIHVQGTAPASYGDSRVRAIEVISGQGETPKMGLTKQSWENMNLPMLDMTGSRDLGVGRRPVEWRRTPFDLSPAGDKYFVSINGATHLSFVGAKLPLLLSARVGGAGQEAIFRWVQMATLAFWDAYMKDDVKARAWLGSDALPQLSRREVTLLRR
jgi:predicted dienelactone hydrolase